MSSYHDPLKQKIIQARVNLLLKHPFFGNLATRLEMKEGWDDLTTAATDGRHIFYCKDFFEKLTVKQIEFVICHEVLHAAFDHIGRREHRSPQIYNIAADYVVNGQLIRDRIGDQPPKELKIFHDPMYYDKSSEEVYDLIFDSMDQQQLEALGQLLDDHDSWESADGNGSGANGSGNAPGQKPSYTKEQLREIRDEMRDAVLQAAQSVGAGNVPAGIARLIKNFTEPKMNWRELIRQQIQSTVKHDYTYMRPSRKTWHLSAILPGSNFADTINIAVAIDLSGSIQESQIRDFLGEVKGIMQQFQDFEIKVMTFDTMVYNEQNFNAYNINEFDDYELKGGGGTNFMCVYDHLKEHNSVPKKLIFFTDMYDFGKFGDDSYCDTLFINHGRPGFEAPHGITVFYEQ